MLTPFERSLLLHRMETGRFGDIDVEDAVRKLLDYIHKAEGCLRLAIDTIADLPDGDTSDRLDGIFVSAMHIVSDLENDLLVPAHQRT